jgi:acid phosphatase family membrane protein YuiD
MSEAAVRLSGRALALAQAMVTQGVCDSLETAVARSVAIATLHDSEQIRIERTLDDAQLKALLRDVEREVESGELGDNAPALWMRLRAAVSTLAADRP